MLTKQRYVGGLAAGATPKEPQQESGMAAGRRTEKRWDVDKATGNAGGGGKRGGGRLDERGKWLFSLRETRKNIKRWKKR